MDKKKDISSRSRARHRTASPLSQPACLSADRDFLEKKAKEIEDTLYYQDLNLFNANVDLVFFDTTSIKFYGEENELMQRGLSKDKRGDLNQVIPACRQTSLWVIEAW